MIPTRILWIVAGGLVVAAVAAVVQFRSQWGAANPVPRPEQHLHALAVSPDGRLLYAGTHQGLYVSRDGGRRWTPGPTPAATAGPDVKLDLMALAIMAGPGPGPGTVPHPPGTPPDVLIGAGHGFGVVRSLDGGATWEGRNTGLPPEPDVHALAVSPADGRTLYASVVDSGIYRSDDQAGHWSRVETSFSNGAVTVLALDPRRPTAGYAAGYGIGAYKTADGGAVWTRLALTDPNLMTLLLDQHEPDRLLVGGRGKIYTSQDAGATWTDVTLPAVSPPSDPLITALAQDPSDPMTMYAASKTGEVWLSHDGGRRWMSRTVTPSP